RHVQAERFECLLEPAAEADTPSSGGLMDSLGELLASDHRHTLEFFFVSLKDVSESTVDREELLYNASVLAHYAQVSTDADADVSAPSDLTGVFDHLVSAFSLAAP